MSDLNTVKDLVQDMVDKGATTVEEVHKLIANLPLDVLEKIEPLEGTAKQAKEIQNIAIGTVYEMIRNVNKRVGEIAGEILAKK